MEVIFLGTGCGVPRKERGASCVVVKIEDEVLVFDTGGGEFTQNVKNRYHL
jgi:ribonuclease BN (tRNA processing enzyme)